MNSLLQIYLDQYQNFFEGFAREITPTYDVDLRVGDSAEVIKIDDAMTRPGTQPSTIPHAVKFPTKFAPREGMEATTLSPTQTTVVEDSSRGFGANDNTPQATFDNDDDDEEIELCGAVKKVIYPTSAKSESGVGLFIFNSDDHKQSVHVSICQDVGKPCDDVVLLRNNYRSQCKQQKVYHELLSLSPEGKPIKERFEFPTSCTCVLRRIKQSN